MKRLCSSWVQKPITCSTPARLYQERSIRTISPAVGQMRSHSAGSMITTAFALRRRRQRDYPGKPRIQVLGDPLDCTPLTGCIPPLEDDEDPRPGVLAPIPEGQPVLPGAAEVRPCRVRRRGGPAAVAARTGVLWRPSGVPEPCRGRPLCCAMVPVPLVAARGLSCRRRCRAHSRGAADRPQGDVLPGHRQPDAPMLGPWTPR